MDPDVIMRIDSIIDEITLSRKHEHSVHPHRTYDVPEILNDWYFITESGRLKLLSPLSSTEAGEGLTNFTEIKFTTHGFDRVRKTGTDKFFNIRVSDGYVSKMPDGDMSQPRQGLIKIRNLNFRGGGIAPSTVSRRFKLLWEDRVRDKFDSVKLGFVKLLEAKHDQERNIVDERCNHLNARMMEVINTAKERGTMMSSTELAIVNDLKQAIEEEKATLDLEKSADKIFEELCRVSNAYAASKERKAVLSEGQDREVDKGVSPPVAPPDDALGTSGDMPPMVMVAGVPLPPREVKKKEKCTSLSLSNLLVYVQEIPLPGRAGPLLKTECDACFRDLELEYSTGSNRILSISIDIFKRWFDDDTIKRKLAEIHKKTFFALLLEESEKGVGTADVGEGINEVQADVVVEDIDDEDAKAYKEIAKSFEKKDSFFKAAWKRIGEARGRTEVEFTDWEDDMVPEGPAMAGSETKNKRGFLTRLLGFGKKKGQSSDHSFSMSNRLRDEFIDEEAVDFADSRLAHLSLKNIADRDLAGNSESIIMDDEEKFIDADDSSGSSSDGENSTNHSAASLSEEEEEEEEE